MKRAIDRVLSAGYSFLHPTLERTGIASHIEAWYERLRIAGGYYEEVTVTMGDEAYTFLTEPGAAADVRSFLTEDEGAVFRDLRASLRADDVIYDIGGGIGYYSIVAATSTPSGEVHTFEPNVRNTVRIAAHASRHGVADRVRTHRVALTDASKGSSQWLDEHRVAGLQYVAGDAYVKAESLPPPTVIKMDIQGGELAAIRGLDEALSRAECRLVYVEVHSDEAVSYALSETEQQELVDELQSQGFEVDRFNRKAHEYFLRARAE